MCSSVVSDIYEYFKLDFFSQYDRLLTFPGSFAVVEGLFLGATKTIIGFIFTSDE